MMNIDKIDAIDVVSQTFNPEDVINGLYNGDFLLEELMSVRGVGPKTAHKFLIGAEEYLRISKGVHLKSIPDHGELAAIKQRALTGSDLLLRRRMEVIKEYGSLKDAVDKDRRMLKRFHEKWPEPPKLNITRPVYCEKTKERYMEWYRDKLQVEKVSEFTPEGIEIWKAFRNKWPKEPPCHKKLEDTQFVYEPGYDDYIADKGRIDRFTRGWEAREAKFKELEVLLNNRVL